MSEKKNITNQLLLKDCENFHQYYVSSLNDFTKEQAGNLPATSHSLVFWQCQENQSCSCPHIWSAPIRCRGAANTGCPYCANHKYCKCQIEKKNSYLQNMVFCWQCQIICSESKNYYQDNLFVICNVCVEKNYLKSYLKVLLRNAKSNTKKRGKKMRKEAGSCTLISRKNGRSFKDCVIYLKNHYIITVLK